MKYDVTLKYFPAFIRESGRLAQEHLLRAARRRLFELREQASCGGRVKVVSKPHFIKKVRKDIARISTILREGR